jgi:hypothetical protein
MRLLRKHSRTHLVMATRPFHTLVSSLLRRRASAANVSAERLRFLPRFKHRGTYAQILRFLSFLFLALLFPRFHHSLPPSPPSPSTTLCNQLVNACMRFSRIYACMCMHVDVHALARECMHRYRCVLSMRVSVCACAPVLT